MVFSCADEAVSVRIYAVQAFVRLFFDMSVFRDQHPKQFDCAKDIVKYTKENARRGDPLSVIEAADEYCRKFAQQSMHIGPKKGPIVDKIVMECKPSLALELGTYWGYTAVRYANLMAPGSKYLSIEFDSEVLQLARELVDFAGLSDRVELIEGSSELVIPTLKEKYQIEAFDFVFIDHDKTLYKPDIIRLEQNGLLKKGSVIAADNVIYPGTPDYLDYVRNSSRFSSTLFESTLTYRTHIKDGIEKSTYL